jgi:hypothetical protein
MFQSWNPIRTAHCEEELQDPKEILTEGAFKNAPNLLEPK